MQRKPLYRHLRSAAAAALALSASFAFADDSSMSVLTGDSYAFFNNLDYNPGRFNTARVDTPARSLAAKTSPQQKRDADRTLIADPQRATSRSVFHDDGV